MWRSGVEPIRPAGPSEPGTVSPRRDSSHLTFKRKGHPSCYCSQKTKVSRTRTRFLRCFTSELAKRAIFVFSFASIRHRCGHVAVNQNGDRSLDWAEWANPRRVKIRKHSAVRVRVLRWWIRAKQFLFLRKLRSSLCVCRLFVGCFGNTMCPRKKNRFASSQDLRKINKLNLSSTFCKLNLRRLTRASGQRNL